MIIFVFFIFLFPQNVSREALEHLQAGMEAHKQGQLDAAIAEFRRATEIEPKLAPAFVNLGQAYMEKHDYGSAIAPLKRALELNQDLAGASQLLGYALLAAGYAAEAIPYLEQVKEQGALGIAQLETGRLPEAVANLQAALAKRPNDPDLLYYLGRASGLLSKDVTDALISAYPDSFRAHQALGENYLALRRLPEAEREYREALRLRPDVPGLHLALGQVYAMGSQWAKAEDEFRAEAGLQPGSSEAAYRLGSALLQQGKAQAAQAELERSDRLKPEMPETLYSLGKAASLNGDSAAAEKAWTRVIEIEKDSSLAAQAHFGLAALYRKQGRLQDAARETEEFGKLQNKGVR
ncbi:MAG: tetratricopeptide repeat protein [Blastocatellia bacterium]|nr:tetratricopeptide repeat protein [Blastocatellia bacterium]